MKPTVCKGGRGPPAPESYEHHRPSNSKVLPCTRYDTDRAGARVRGDPAVHPQTGQTGWSRAVENCCHRKFSVADQARIHAQQPIHSAQSYRVVEFGPFGCAKQHYAEGKRRVAEDTELQHRDRLRSRLSSRTWAGEHARVRLCTASRKR